MQEPLYSPRACDGLPNRAALSQRGDALCEGTHVIEHVRQGGKKSEITINWKLCCARGKALLVVGTGAGVNSKETKALPYDREGGILQPVLGCPGIPHSGQDMCLKHSPAQGG